MAESSETLSSIRFGRFDLSVETGELRKEGVRLKLSGQAVEVLLLLVASPGKLVAREELQQKLWPGASYGDPEHGLNAAVNRLRETLGDSATEPKYIETVPGRGYRFIARLDLPSVAVPKTVPSEARHGWPHLRWLALLGVLATVIVALAFWFRAPLPAPKVLGYTPLTHDRERKFPPLVTDGTRLYFTMPKKTGWTIAQVSASGGETAPIPSHFDDIQLADISPNGSELLIGQFDFSRDVPIYILPLPAGLPRRVGDILAHDASWSPNGQQIVYVHGNELYLAKPDGSDSRRLVTLAGRAYWTRWSPDGKVLRFTVEDWKTDAESLWEVATDGTGLRPLLPGWSSPPAECCGNWTPDGNYFVFQSDRKQDLWAIREKSGFLSKHNSEPIQLTTGPGAMVGSVPSRDGKKLFAIQGAPLGELVRYDAKSQQFLPYLSGISAIHLSFSKDGQWVVYISYPDGALWRSKVDGTERLQLTSPPPGSHTAQMVTRWEADCIWCFRTG
jgi:DNA-binding winged helix-turn-helix (wHTH) protein